MSRFDRIILGSVIGLALAIGILTMASIHLGPSVDSISTVSALDGVSVNTQIGVTFTEPMNHPSVEHHWLLAPHIAGDFSWAGNELIFSPRHSLAYATKYTLKVGGEAIGQSGKRLAHGVTHRFTTQAQHLLYLGTSGAEAHHLVLASVTGKRQIVGLTSGEVGDFSVSSDLSLVVYTHQSSSSANPDEIWLLSLADNSTQSIFRHPGWNISQPHFSPDGRYIVFLATNVRLCQKYYGCYVDKSGPVVFLLDVRSHKVHQFSAGQDTPLTDFIDFSPAGQVAYTDLGSALTLAMPDGSHVSHIPNLGNSLVYQGFDPSGDKAAFVGQTPNSTGGDILVYQNGRSGYIDVSMGVYDSSTPSFSTTGNQLAYVGYRGELGIEPIYGINIYDFATKRTRRITAERQLSDWAPRWSSDDRYIAFIRSQPQEAMYMGAGEIWVMHPNGSDAHPLGGVGSDVRWVS